MAERRSQVGNLCSAACGKVVARNLEIAEVERWEEEREESAGGDGGVEKERSKKTRREKSRDGGK